jgi:hypothetical protein
MAILRDPEHGLQSLDVSGNDLTAEHLEQMRLSMANNRNLFSIDLRSNPGYDEGKHPLPVKIFFSFYEINHNF